jgi:hypothetical protein
MFLKNSRGEKSGSFTFAAIAFFITSVSILLGIFESFSFGDLSMSFRSLDASIITAYLAPIMCLYFGRRWTVAKFDSSANEDDLDE